jgi:hypothetical protein
LDAVLGITCELLKEVRGMIVSRVVVCAFIPSGLTVEAHIGIVGFR